MRFALTEEQRDFRDAVDSLLRDANGVAAARAWAAGDTKPGLEIWRGLAAIGVHSLAGEYPVELCTAMERIGYHAAPGPYPESLAVAAALPEWRPRIAAGAIVTAAVPPVSPYAPNADIAEACFPAADSQPVASLDPTRSLFRIAERPQPEPAPAPAELILDTAALLTAAQLLGLGRAALDMTVAYAKQRVQYGRAIGEYQAVKHRLADAHTGLEFARPLVFAAALSAEPRDVSAAKAAASEAAYRAARAALQLHGAIGYTDEYDLSVYFKKIRSLHAAWGGPAFHRDRLLRDLGEL
ncbi:acyl-CoA dehydrogenase family protein [Catenulispora pinisilvae]|uniref:acyl-CoA dehydrogenase family protein n=1 Tax=Catenulispora pinisilvae TaxID=2705253 RepID=UPI0018924590|nr:acyl-CoA dehydrogenase family protein [Catenulispora pinisilvae]